MTLAKITKYSPPTSSPKNMGKVKVNNPDRNVLNSFVTLGEFQFMSHEIFAGTLFF